MLLRHRESGANPPLSEAIAAIRSYRQLSEGIIISATIRNYRQLSAAIRSYPLLTAAYAGEGGV